MEGDGGKDGMWNVNGGMIRDVKFGRGGRKVQEKEERGIKEVEVKR